MKKGPWVRFATHEEMAAGLQTWWVEMERPAKLLYSDGSTACPEQPMGLLGSDLQAVMPDDDSEEEGEDDESFTR